MLYFIRLCCNMHEKIKLSKSNYLLYVHRVMKWRSYLPVLRCVMMRSFLCVKGKPRDVNIVIGERYGNGAEVMLRAFSALPVKFTLVIESNMVSIVYHASKNRAPLPT